MTNVVKLKPEIEQERRAAGSAHREQRDDIPRPSRQARRAQRVRQARPEGQYHHIGLPDRRSPLELTMQTSDNDVASDVAPGPYESSTSLTLARWTCAKDVPNGLTRMC
jgi:hypothetical protein